MKPGGFYGNKDGYSDVTDSSDSAMEQLMVWITNKNCFQVLDESGGGTGPLVVWQKLGMLRVVFRGGRGGWREYGRFLFTVAVAGLGVGELEHEVTEEGDAACLDFLEKNERNLAANA